ncbi:hypothetical protein Fmac_018268 [Flemingia macrophylla]|uniref:Uncharacterized protein n=1 Tax=Flemingia macrophylla TaxID=520843 RepID=A0ABD1M4H2_9FABA
MRSITCESDPNEFKKYGTARTSFVTPTAPGLGRCFKCLHNLHSLSLNFFKFGKSTKRICSKFSKIRRDFRKSFPIP